MRFTAERGRIQDVRLLLGEPGHDYAQRHPHEVVDLEEAMQQEDDEDHHAENRANRHADWGFESSGIFFLLLHFLKSLQMHSAAVNKNFLFIRLGRGHTRKIDKNFLTFDDGSPWFSDDNLQN